MKNYLQNFSLLLILILVAAAPLVFEPNDLDSAAGGHAADKLKGLHTKLQMHTENLAPLHGARVPAMEIPNRFIVILDTEHPRAVNLDHGVWLTTLINSLGNNHAMRIEHEYNVGSFKGYSGSFENQVVELIRGRPEVKYVERDQIMYASNVQVNEDSIRQFKLLLSQLDQSFETAEALGTNLNFLVNKVDTANPLIRNSLNLVEKNKGGNKKSVASTCNSSGLSLLEKNPKPAHIHLEGGNKKNLKSNQIKKQSGTAPWGLGRISSAGPVFTGDSSTYVYPKSAGVNVDVYVIDTGINITHKEFEGRARWGVTIPTGDLSIDGNGHGTHCSGTIGGRTFGVAKKVHLIAVKVLRTSGFGTNSDVLKGVEWALHAAKASKKPSVANMSLGGDRSLALEQAVNEAFASGLHFSVAAGNDSMDACDFSPAAACGPLTVGAVDVSDTMAYFSNQGSCVDIFGPGVDVLSTWIGSNTATNVMSGTSMASPHVAGVLALYLGSGKHYSTTQLKQKILADAESGLLLSVPSDTDNLMIDNLNLIRSTN